MRKFFSTGSGSCLGSGLDVFFSVYVRVFIIFVFSWGFSVVGGLLLGGWAFYTGMGSFGEGWDLSGMDGIFRGGMGSE